MAEPQTVVVTGVSSGIGWGALKVLAARGVHVFGSVRKQEDADRLKAEFGDSFTPLPMDVTDEDAVTASAAQVRQALAGSTLSGLVNNAGISVNGPLLHVPMKDFRKQLEVNLVGTLRCIQAFAPLLGVEPDLKGPKGRIVNITSIGGKNAFPFVGPYHTVKFGLEGMSDSLRREMMLYGIDTIVVAPGSVKTPIWDKAGADAAGDDYKHTDFAQSFRRMIDQMQALGEKGYPPEKIGETIHKALSAERPKARYVITPDLLQYYALRVLPKRIADGIIGKALGLLPSRPQ